MDAPTPPSVTPGLYLHACGTTARVTAVDILDDGVLGDGSSGGGIVHYFRPAYPDIPLTRPLAEFLFPGRYTRIGD